MTTDRELKALLGGISLESLKDHAKALHRDAKVCGQILAESAADS